MDQVRGLFRSGDWVQAEMNIQRFPILKDNYEARGYQPSFDRLPTKEQYEAEFGPDEHTAFATGERPRRADERT